MKTRDLRPRAQTVISAAIAAAMLWCASAWAVPATIQYQGYLSDAAGEPVTGVLRIVFRLYGAADPAAAPVALWEEVHDSVAITAGKFAAELGGTSPFGAAGVTFEQALFLELEIGLERLQPRLPLHSAPYALKAAGVVAGGVTAPMLAAGAVTPGKVHVTLAGTGLAVSAAGTLQVATGGITADLLADGSIADRHVSAAAAISPTKIAGTAVTLAGTQTLTNKTFDADANHLANVDLGDFRPGVVLADLTALPKTGTGDDNLATAAAIVLFVQDALAGQDSLGELADTLLASVAAGDILVADSAGLWVNRTLSGDLHLGQDGSATIGPDAVALGADTSGFYVATLDAGAGLSGGGSAEGLAATLAVNVDGVTVQIAADALRVGVIAGGNIAADAIGSGHIQNAAVSNAKLANPALTVGAGAGLAGGGTVALGGSTTLGVAAGGIGTAQIAAGAVTNDRLANPALTVGAGTGLAGGGTVALGGSTTLSVAAGGIGADQLAANIDVSTKGFRAATAASADWATDADAVDGAGLDDSSLGAGDTLWSSQRIKEYVDGLVLGLDWQNSVAAFVTAVPAEPHTGLRVVAASSFADWTAGRIYEFGAGVWAEITPNEGFALWVEDETENRNYVYTGTAWVPLSSTQDHAGLAGLQGGDAATEQYFHITEAMHGTLASLTDLAGSRLLADADGVPTETDLTDWLAGSANQVTVSADGNGGAVLSLPQDLATTSSPGFVALRLGASLSLGEYAITAIGNDPTLAGGRSAALPTEHAVKAYVDAAVAGNDALAELADVVLAELTTGDLLQYNGTAWVNIAQVPGENIELKEKGGLTHGSGLMLDLADDGTLEIAYDGLRVGQIGGDNIVADAIGTGHLQDGAVTNGKLATPALTVSAGTGLTGGGSVTLGGSTTLGVAEGGIGADQLAANIDVSAKGFRAATAAVADWATDADAVDGAGLDDSSAGAADALWSSLKIKDYVDALAMGLDWQDAVQSIVTVAPTAAAPGTRIIANHVPGWNHGSIYRLDGALWTEVVPHEGWALWVMDEDLNYVFNGTDWVSISSTQNHASLAGLQGGVPASAEYYHIPAVLHGALTGLPADRLLSANAIGLPAATDLTDWLHGSAEQVTVTADGKGGAVLSLPQDLAPASSPEFAALSLDEGLTLARYPVSAISNDPTLAADRSAALPTEHAVKAYVDAALAGNDTLAELDDVALTDLTPGHLLQFDGTDWVNIAQVPGENIELKPAGAIAHGSGLYVNVDGTTIQIVADALRVGLIGTGNIATDAIGTGQIQNYAVTNAKLANAALTVGAGTGLTGGGTVALGGSTTLSVAPDGIGATQLADDAVDGDAIQDGVVTNAKLANAALTVGAGTGLTGGGTVALGGSTTLGVAVGGIGAEQLAANIDVSSQGFRAATASSTDWATNADAVDGAGLDDSSLGAGNTLWSSQRIKEYVDGLVLGLDWQNSVVAFVAAVPTAPPPGLRVLAGSGSAGWNANSIYERIGADWVETVPNEGFALWVEDEDRNYVYTGSAWVPLSSTQNHALLGGLQGGDSESAQYYHLTEALYGALTSLGGGRLLASDETGLPAETGLADWLQGTGNQVTVTASSSGGAVLSLPQDLAPASSPEFLGLELGSGGLTLGGSQATGISDDPTLADDSTAALPTEHAVKAYVDAALAGKDTLAELIDVALTDLASGNLLQFNGSAWVNIAQVPGENIELKYGGAITHGSGLQINLAADGTLVIVGNAIGVGTLGSGNIGSDAVALGTKTTGDYVASLTAGAGLSGDGTGEGSTPTLAINIDDETLAITDDRLQVADGGIGTPQVAAGAITNDKLEHDALTVSAGTGLAGGGSVALGGSTTLGVAVGGIGADQLAASIDVSSKGFRAATAASTDWATNADAVDGAGLDDSSLGSIDTLWSSQRVKEYVDGLILGLDWQNSVVGFVTAIPPTPPPGLRVIARTGIEGWDADRIYERVGAAWIKTAPNEGFALWVEDEDRNYVYTGTAWVLLSSTQNHEALSGLLGGGEDGHYHIDGLLYGALTSLGGGRLLASDETGLPAETGLADWLQGTGNQVTVTADGNGGAVLSLPQDLATTSSPDFAGLALGSGGLTLGGFLVTGISDDPTLADDSTAALPTEHAIKAYVDAALAGKDALAELIDVALTDLASGNLLQFNGSAWVNIAQVPGENIELKYGGAITHGSGLQINLAADGTLVIVGNAIGVGTLGSGNIGNDAIALGIKTTGDYVASLSAGAGLSGDGTGEGSTPTLAINIDDETLAITDDVLHVADGGIGTPQVAAGAITNDKLATDSLTVSAGTGLAGGGNVALGGSTTLSVADGGIGADQLADNIDAAGKGFNADAVDGADVNDAGGPDAQVLWSSAKISDFVGGLLNGLDWQQSVNFVTTVVPTGTIAAGTRVIAAGIITGWNDHSIYQYNGTGWVETAPRKGFATWVKDQMRNYVFNGSEWVTFGSTEDHQALTGLQGGNLSLEEYYHLDNRLYSALTGLTGSRLLADTAGLPTETDLTDWLAGTTNQVTVTSDGNGGAKLALPQNITTTSTVQFSRLTLGSGGLVLGGSTITGIGTNTALPGGSNVLPTEPAVKGYVDAVAGLHDELAELADVALADLAPGDLLQFDGTAWVNIAQIPGANIELAPYGGITHGSGLKIDLDGDGTLALSVNGLKVGVVGSANIGTDAVALGAQTTGDYVARVKAGAGLSGGGSGEGSTAMLAASVDGTSVVLVDDALSVGTIDIVRLQGIGSSGQPGQTVLADGSGGFRLGSEMPMYLNQDTAEWSVARLVPTGAGSEPRGVAQDITGKLYVADPASNCIRVFASHGEYLGWYGKSGDSGGKGFTGFAGFHASDDPGVPVAGNEAGAFSTPRAVAVMAADAIYVGKACTGDGFLWVADSGNNRLQAIDLSATWASAQIFSGDILDLVNANLFDEYGLANPSGIAVLGAMIWIADTDHHRVYEIDFSGRYFVVKGWYGCTAAEALVDRQGSWHDSAIQHDPAVAGGLDLQFTLPTHLSAMIVGSIESLILAVADSGNSRVMLVNVWATPPEMWGWIGGDDAIPQGRGWHGPSTTGPLPLADDGDGAFRQPDGVSFSSFGLVISDAVSNVLEFYSLPDSISIVGGKGLPLVFSGSFGMPGSAAGQFSAPSGLGNDLDGALWVCDTGNARLQKLQPPHTGTFAVVPPESGSVIIGGDAPAASAALQIDSCNGGLLLPRYVDTNQLYDCITNPVEGLLAYCYGTQMGGSQMYGQGFYFWNGDQWDRLGNPALASYGGLKYTYLGELAVDWNANPYLYKQVSGPKAGEAGTHEVRDSAGLQTALTAARGALAEAPVVVRLAPGVYTTPLALSSHVDIEGSGVGKTVLRLQGGTAVTAAEVVNASLRQLTIEVVGQGGTGDLIGLECAGAATTLRLEHVEIKVSGSTPGRSVGIRCGQGSRAATAGLRLEHVWIEVTGAATGGVAALEVKGSADVLDCDLRAGNSAGAAVGVLLDPRGLETASFRQVTVSVTAAAAEAAACRVRGAGAVQLKGCVLKVAGGAGGSVLAVSGESADRLARVRIEETSLRLDAAPADPAAAKARIGNHGRLDAFSAQMLGPGAATAIDGSGRLAAFYCLMEGPCASAATARYTYCTALDPQTGDGVPLRQAGATPR